MRTSTVLLSSVAAAMLAACGGGGGGGSSGSGSGNPSGGATGTDTGTSSVCFNPAAFVTGSTIHTVTLGSFGANGSATYTSDTTVDGTAAFNGVSTIKTSEAVSFAPDATLAAANNPASTSTALRYYALDSGADSVKEYGAMVSSAAASDPNATTTSAFTYTPSVETRFDLAAQASFSQTYTQATTTTSPNATTQASSSTYAKTVLFVGTGPVTVPAGTFQTCEYVETGTVTTGGTTASTGTLTSWLGVGNGLTIKAQTQQGGAGSAVTGTFGLVSASINGQAVSP